MHDPVGLPFDIVLDGTVLDSRVLDRIIAIPPWGLPYRPVTKGLTSHAPSRPRKRRPYKGSKAAKRASRPKRARK